MVRNGNNSQGENMAFRNYDKLHLGQEMNSHGPFGSVGHTQCHDYGSKGGCDVNCPALWNGECQVVEEVMGKCPFEDDEIAELTEIYYKFG